MSTFVKSFSSACGVLAVIAISACTGSLQSCSSSKYLTYEDFGAKGDGVTDDFPAIIATHAAANDKGLPVKATDGKTYYIGNTIGTAVIRTSVDFGKAKFIIDDSQVEVKDRGANIFKVVSDKKPIDVEGVNRLMRGQKSIGTTLPGRCLVSVENANRKVYIRYGLNQNNGTSAREFFVADKDGVIEEASAVVWDYEEITSMKAYPIDEETLEIKGGIFTTIANQAPSEYTYYGRGIQVNRSNVKIDNVTHYVEGELDHGAPYSGFFTISTAADITISNCLLTPHKTYVTIGSAGKPVSMGSYDINPNSVVNFTMEHIRQTIDINDNKYWGLIGSNFCKVIKFDDCIISRFDAHQGVRNVSLLNSKFGYMGVQMVGSGTMYIENCEIYRSSLIALRDDYGSSWEGDLIIKDSKVIPPAGASNVTILTGSNTGKHDFGYTCYLPTNIRLENVVFDDKGITNKSYAGPAIFGTFNRNLDDPDLLPYVAKGKVVLKNVSTTSGKPFELSKNPRLFADYEIVNE